MEDGGDRYFFVLLLFALAIGFFGGFLVVFEGFWWLFEGFLVVFGSFWRVLMPP